MEINFLPHNHDHMVPNLQKAMPKAETFEMVSDLLKMMSDSKRIEIFWILCHCEECVSNISSLLDMSSSAVLHHLKLLKNTGLIISCRKGKEVYYTAAKTSRSQILHFMIEQVIEVACPFDEFFNKSNTYDSTVQTINDVHELLTTDLKRRYTIEELALKFHINQTTLKSTFKTVFGHPIATYMKEYRIKRAMAYLTQSDKSIAEISYEVGYVNQSKFTQAFKEITGILPRDYRKKH